MAARAHEPLVLSTGERNRLTEWAAQASGRHAARAAIVLACADGQSDAHVAAQAGVSRATVAKWRARFAMARLPGLQDLPRPGTPRKITDVQVRDVLARTLSEPPPPRPGPLDHPDHGGGVRAEPVGGQPDLAVGRGGSSKLYDRGHWGQ